MDCQDIQSKLADYIDGRLSGIDRSQLQNHLVGCKSCRSALAEIDPLAVVLLQSEPPPVPSNLTSRILAAARDRMHHQQPAPWNPLSWWRLAPASMQAAAVGILVVGLGLGFALGKSTAKSAATEATIGPKADPLEVYQLDYFGDAPSGSLTDAYLALITTGNQGGQ
jgi:anti-sigma factor RsiW